MWCITQANDMWNENNSNANLHSTKILEEQRDKFLSILTFLVWSEMSLDMQLSAGGWLYL